MGTVPDFSKIKQKRVDCPHFITGLTLVEIIMVIAVLILLTSGTWLVLRNFLQGRSIEVVAENLVQLIRAVQTSAKETESVQIVLLAKEGAIWMKGEEVIRRQKFKNNVKIEGLELAGKSVEVPEEPREDIKITIDEKGSAESAMIVLANEKESIIISVGGGIVTTGGGSLGALDFGSDVIPTNVGIQAGEDVLLVQTEPLQARGWQVITVNNVDKVKEVKLRVKLDGRLPTSGHIHVYVFPGWYENKPVAHGVTGQQTMLDNNGTVPTYRRDCPHFLYRESTEDCLAFFNGTYTVSGTLMKENRAGLANYVIRLNVNVNFFQVVINTTTLTGADGSYRFTGEAPSGFTTWDLRCFTLLSSQPQPYPYYITPFGYGFANFSGSTIGNFIAHGKIMYDINGSVAGLSREGVTIRTTHISQFPPGVNGSDILKYDNQLYNITNPVTSANGHYKISLPAHHYYELKPVKPGCTFEPSSVTIFLDKNTTQNFNTAIPGQGSYFGDNKPPLGDWTYSETEIQNVSMLANVPIFSNTPLGYYIYKNKTVTAQSPMKRHYYSQLHPMFTGVYWTTNGMKFSSVLTPDNILNPGGLSDFATENASLVYDSTALFDDAHWQEGYVYSDFASQEVHASTQIAKEAAQTEWTNWFTIPVNSLPSQTKFLRIAIAAYSDNNKEQVFNMAPTISSTHPIQTTIPINKFTVMDYETDPFMVYYPWSSLINDPFWLSHYAYAMKPIVRPYGVNVLAAEGPVSGKNYKNTNSSYKGFWYGPLYLDWDLILGAESLYWLIAWNSGVFELTNYRWKFTQQGETYNGTAYAPPSHYLLKNFAYLSYWYLFEYVSYNAANMNQFPKRFQEPLNFLANSANFISRRDPPGGIGSSPSLSEPNENSYNYGWMKLFERMDSGINSLPHESSSLSMPFLANPIYPTWLPTLPPAFFQGRITSSPDLYSSLFYLQEKINHTMLDIGVWTVLTSPSGNNANTVSISIFGVPIPGEGADPTSPTIGNFDYWSYNGSNTLSSWWPWYQNIPWAKGQAFPQKTGINPNNYTERTGWERPIITQPSSYWDYFSTELASYNFLVNPNNSYNVLQVVNTPHTIFMSTSHYPLGVVQIAVKK